MLSDYDVVPSPPSGQNYVFQTDILGASEYISSSLRRELESFLRRMGYKCQDITSNGFCIEIVFPYLLESEEHNKLDFIMKQFIRDKLATVRMEMIPNVSRENEEIIKTIVKRESKGTAIAVCSYQTDTMWYFGSAGICDHVLEVIGMNHFSPPPTGLGMDPSKDSTYSGSLLPETQWDSFSSSLLSRPSQSRSSLFAPDDMDQWTQNADGAPYSWNTSGKYNSLKSSSVLGFDPSSTNPMGSSNQSQRGFASGLGRDDPETYSSYSFSRLPTQLSLQETDGSSLLGDGSDSISISPRSLYSKGANSEFYTQPAYSQGGKVPGSGKFGKNIRRHRGSQETMSLTDRRESASALQGLNSFYTGPYLGSGSDSGMDGTQGSLYSRYPPESEPIMAVAQGPAMDTIAESEGSDSYSSRSYIQGQQNYYPSSGMEGQNSSSNYRAQNISSRQYNSTFGLSRGRKQVTFEEPEISNLDMGSVSDMATSVDSKGNRPTTAVAPSPFNESVRLSRLSASAAPSDASSTVFSFSSKSSGGSYPHLSSISVGTDEMDLTRPLFNPLATQYKPNGSLSVHSIPCPLYADVLNNNNGIRISIGHNHEMVEFILAFHYEDLLNELQNYNIQVTNYYLNNHGFFAVVAQRFPDMDMDHIIRKVMERHMAGVMKTQRISLPLDDEHFINYLLYVTENSHGNVAVHRVNEDSVCFVGSGDDLIAMTIEARRVSRDLISESAEKQQMTPKEILESCEDVIIPTLTVTGSLLQQVWKQGFVPRQLDSEDPSFICYVSRCRRRLLLAYIQKLLSLNSPDDVTHVICCVDAYYLVFKNYAAPNRERWKKYKSRVTATEMNLFVNCIKLDIKEKTDYERIRSSIEQLSNMSATLYVNKGSAYVVGDLVAIQKLRPHLDFLFSVCSQTYHNKHSIPHTHVELSLLSRVAAFSPSRYSLPLHSSPKDTEPHKSHYQ